jgi:hypothetical protein
LELNRENFTACLRTRFEVAGLAGGSVSTELVDVNLGTLSPKLDTFSLVFLGPMSPFLPQGIYRLTHEKFGDISLFLVPIGPNRGGMQYEAVFNRILDGAR